MGKKLLIVEDKMEIRLLVRATLEYEGWEVFEAGTGESGVEAAVRHQPDLIIMDVIMPGKIDGVEAAKLIKSNPETSWCEIIMLSGTDAEVRDRAFEVGVTKFIQKPFSPLDLIEEVGTLFVKPEAV